MKAKEESFYSKERQPLSEKIPLDTPFTINIEPSGYCNLECKFCGHSSDDYMKDFYVAPQMMVHDTFSCVVEQMGEFPHKFKIARLAGYGEPLLNPDIAQYISELKKADVVEAVQIFTNGIPLNHSLSEKIVDAGLDRMLVSVNGLSNDDYRENTNRNVNFDDFVSEIKYLYSIKNQLQIDIKIADACLPSDGKQRFLDIFGNYCDRISVEGTHILVHNTKSYGNLSDKKNALWKFKELADRQPHVCPMPFYSMSVLANGEITVCNTINMRLTTEGLNLKKCRLYEVWNGSWHKEVLIKSLKEDYSGSAKICGVCSRKFVFAFPEDSLDEERDRLVQVINNME